MFERYTDRSRRSLVLAQEQARTLGHPEIDSGHLLIGLAAEGDSIACRALRALGLDMAAATAAMGSLPPRRDDVPARIPFTARCKRDLDGALREALALGHNYIGTEHLLLSLVRHPGGTAQGLLDTEGITPEDVRGKVMELLGVYQKAPADSAGPAAVADWTVDPQTNRSNSSPRFVALCGEVERLIRSEAHSLLAGRADRAAALIMAQLAHVHHLVPADLLPDAAPAPGEQPDPSGPLPVRPKVSRRGQERSDA